jgi:hypothetical protein
VNSVPAGGKVYIAPTGAVKKSESVFNSPRIVKETRCGQFQVLKEGEYDVFVALWIGDSNLMEDPEYWDLRRDIEEKGEHGRLTSYFLPDGAADVFVLAPPHEEKRIVRRYACEVFNKTWSPVIALFLPNLPPSEIIGYVPQETAFGLDGVSGELEFYRIPERDRAYLTRILERIGVAPYWSEGDAVYRIFRVSLTNGRMLSPLVIPAKHGPRRVSWLDGRTDALASGATVWDRSRGVHAQRPRLNRVGGWR